MNNFSIKDFYQSRIDKLFTDQQFRDQIIAQTVFPENEIYLSFPEREIFNKIFSHFLEEAELSLSLLDDIKFDRESKILEIGGGIGLVYAFLKSNGYKIYGLEPSEAGFSNYYDTAIHLFRVLEIDSATWYSYLAEESEKIGEEFDIVFSNNVFEHILNLKLTLDALKRVLKQDGVMVHNTVNYLFPYEPHFKIFLVPFWPRLTTLFRPDLKKSTLWKGLNFINTFKMSKMCRLSGLDIEYDRNALLNTFKRLENDGEFAKRQRRFIPVLKFLKYSGLIKTLKYFPACLTTPMRFQLKRK
ncbi:MAG: hypothetical protein COT91_04625 [Candidatus Doudnabacteria bacterium CG10_big_fil_rev_8_21_14_0_10_41_10]|uniref:Methyltransferase type 11 domain-containing protein n=1 Tax=Candidatus Doudnabacteria bacterium CG10_big_fil_rev_8_21_14_0_10_41_10 TaxID=1974551 RepID=A0A2H0VCG0_9BACT|nr:MAG: hypothetical protein COT91_04625 [Candidatus Doudnabacteria bacterium CG10_big_fil_rev_8_21_14_0_10_41_10]